MVALKIVEIHEVMVKFKDVDDLRAHLLEWEAVYGEYAEVLWDDGGIRSSDMIVGYSPEVLAEILAAGGPLRPLHTGRARDIISRASEGGVKVVNMNMVNMNGP